MVDVSDLMKANALLDEKARFEQAIRGLDEGGRIVSMTIALEPEEGRPEGTSPRYSVRTDFMHPPQQMIDAIKEEMRQHYRTLIEELAGLGVTGVDTQPRTARGVKR